MKNIKLLIMITILLSGIFSFTNIYATEETSHTHNENDPQDSCSAIIEISDLDNMKIESTNTIVIGKTIIETFIYTLDKDTTMTRGSVICSCGGTSRTQISSEHRSLLYSESNNCSYNHIDCTVKVWQEYDFITYRCNSCGSYTNERSNYQFIVQHHYTVHF